MNARIEKIAEQAGIPTPLDSHLEAFAIMLVQECIDVSDNVAQGDISRCCTETAIKISNKISKRFSD